MWAMAVIVFILTELLKLPIKRLTKKLGGNSKLRVNAVIVLISVAVGVLIYYLYCRYVAHIEFQVSSGASLGGLASMVYEIISRLIGKKLENPFTTNEGKEVIDAVTEASKDELVTKEEVKSVVNLSVKKREKMGAKNSDEAQPEEIQDFVKNIGLK